MGNPDKAQSKQIVNTHLFLLEHVCLAQYLHGVDVPRVLLLHQPHLPERTPTDHLQRLKVLHPQPRALQSQELGLLQGVLVALLLLLYKGKRKMKLKSFQVII